MKLAQAGLSHLGSHSWEFEREEAEEISRFWVLVLEDHESPGAEAAVLSHGHISQSVN